VPRRLRDQQQAVKQKLLKGVKRVRETPPRFHFAVTIIHVTL